MENSLPREHLPAGHLVCSIGDPGDAAYLVEAGSVEISARGGQRVAVLTAGEIFGEVALLDQLPRTATVRTLEPTTLLRIERGYVQELLKRTDPVIRHLLTLLLERFRYRSGDMGSLPPSIERDLPSDGAAAMLTFVLVKDLTYAMENGKLDLVYQPLIDLGKRSLVGFEALIRWQHPLIGNITPTKLIGLAEKTGLICPLGLWVLRQALTDWPTLRGYCRTSGDAPPFISVNLSTAELANPRIAESIEDLLKTTGISPRELNVELTETTLIEDMETTGAVLEKLAATGVTIALDDFGTGYAGFDYIKALPISCLKIDKTFVLEMNSSPRSREIVQTSIKLAHSLGMRIIAEGIEDESSAALLAALGCDIAQGYLYAMPLSLSAIPKWFDEARALGRLAE